MDNGQLPHITDVTARSFSVLSAAVHGQESDAADIALAALEGRELDTARGPLR